MSIFAYRALATRVTILGVVASALIAGAARPAAAQFDPSAQFSPVVNPNGVWSYGYEHVPVGSPFSLLTVPGPIPGTSVDAWRTPTFGDVGVMHNGTALAQPVVGLSDNAVFQAGELAMHPGPNDEYGIVQFTAPANGNYKIGGTFQSIDITGLTNTNVALLWNNAVVASGVAIGFATVPLSFGPVPLNVGDTLAFAVGGNPFHGYTGLLSDAQVAAVGIPEPSSLVLVGIAIMSLAGYRLRKRFV